MVALTVTKLGNVSVVVWITFPHADYFICI